MRVTRLLISVAEEELHSLAGTLNNIALFFDYTRFGVSRVNIPSGDDRREASCDH